MATPLYDALKVKVRDWSNRREVATVPEGVIEDCLKYGNDDIYRTLRIPQLEFTTQYTVTEANNTVKSYSRFDVPEDLIEFVYLCRRNVTDGTVTWMYNQVNDIRTFLDPYADQYNNRRYVWKDLSILVSPKLEVGEILELHYYRRLGQLDALYSVVAANYSFDYPDASQPLLTLDGAGTPLYKVTGGTTDAIFDTEAEGTAYAVTNGGTVVPVTFVGNEAWNWLRDANERLVIFAALRHVGAYLVFPEMEDRYSKATEKTIDALNREEKFRRAKGGNVQINVNTGGLI